MKPAFQAKAPGVPVPDCWVLVLNRYQRDNLLWLLNAIGYPGDANRVDPFGAANTGDWLGEIAQMLAKDDGPHFDRYEIDADDAPNMSFAELRERVQRWKERAETGEMVENPGGSTLTFRDARGALPRLAGEPIAEDIIRRVRDARKGDDWERAE